MALRRMFSLEVVNTDQFLDLPHSSQALYFHLGMRADDDGFVASPRRITAMVGSKPSDLEHLVNAGLVLRFPSGVCVIRHWRTNNLIKKDRYHETQYLEEMAQLTLDQNGQYRWNPSGTQSEPQVRLGQDRLGQES